MGTLNEHVYQQNEDINVVADQIVQSTEYITSGNENLREAMMQHSNFRVAVAFFLLMCTFSLLFLEWYS